MCTHLDSLRTSRSALLETLRQIKSKIMEVETQQSESVREVSEPPLPQHVCSFLYLHKAYFYILEKLSAYCGHIFCNIFYYLTSRVLIVIRKSGVACLLFPGVNNLGVYTRSVLLPRVSQCFS